MPLWSLLMRRGLGPWLADAALILVRRVDGGRGQRGEVARPVSKLVLDGEGREATEATASFVLLLEALRQQPALEGEGIEGRERGRYLAGAGTGEVGERQVAHAGAGQAAQAGVGGIAGRLMGVRARLEAARAIGVVGHHGGAMAVVKSSKAMSWTCRRRGSIADAGPSCVREAGGRWGSRRRVGELCRAPGRDGGCVDGRKGSCDGGGVSSVGAASRREGEQQQRRSGYGSKRRVGHAASWLRRTVRVQRRTF